MAAISFTSPVSIERQILPLKLAPAPLRLGVLLRPDLQALLAEARLRPVALVTAPAGYGKTTLLAQWARDLNRTSIPTCWLTLDSGDRDPGLFLAYLIRSLQKVFPDVGSDAWRILNSAGSLQRDWPLVAGAICGDLQRQIVNTTFLFLDDLHLVIESAVIAQILGYFVRAAPPTLHIVAASRRTPAFAPLGRMRAEGLLLEIGQRDLHLSAVEAEQLLSAQGIVLDPSELGLLLARTEGWPLSLQLAARALVAQPIDQRAAFVRDLSGSQEQLIDYLTTEVLADLPNELIDFLRLAALPTYFDAELLERVLLQENAHYLLQRAQGLGLPITPLDDQGTSLRFHTIWRELLLRGVEATCDAETIAALHRRFGHAFEQRGDLQAALDHYASAGAEDELVRALRNHAWPLLQSPRRDIVRRWLELLPENLRDTNPDLLYMWGYSQIIINPERASTTIEQAAELFRQTGQYQRELRALSDLAALLFLEGRESRFAALSMWAVRAANRVRDAWSRGAALVCVTAMLYAKGRELAALQVARQASARPLSPAWHWLLTMISATIELRLGRPDVALTAIEAALRVQTIDEDDRLRQNLLRLHALARFDQGYAAEATAAALAAHAYLGNYQHTGIVSISAQQIALILTLQGRVDEATTYIAQARVGFHDRGSLAPLASLQAIELYGSMIRGNAARAIGAVATALRRLNESGAVIPDLRLKLLLAIVLGEGGDRQSALILVRELVSAMLERGYRVFLISAELYAAHLEASVGNPIEQEQHLREGWSMAEADRLSYIPDIPVPVLASVAEAALLAGIAPATVTRVLRRQAPEQAAELLQRLLGNPDPVVRARAAGVLGDMGISSAFPALRALVKDRNAEVRQAAEHALGRLIYRPPYQLAIRTLGSFGIWRGDQEVRDRDWRSSKARQLFQLLVTERGRALTREQVTEILWPDMEPDAAANNLRVTINRLGKALEPDRPEGAPPAYILQQSETYGLNLESDLEIDAATFANAIDEGRTAYLRNQRSVALQVLRRAVGLYSGPYLPDCLYEDWAAVERDRLSLLFSEGALLLASMLYEDGQYHESIGLAWRILDQDRTYEDAYRLLMRAHMALGERTTALRLYERCVTVLREDLGVTLLPETVALAEQIRG